MFDCPCTFSIKSSRRGNILPRKNNSIYKYIKSRLWTCILPYQHPPHRTRFLSSDRTTIKWKFSEASCRDITQWWHDHAKWQIERLLIWQRKKCEREAHKRTQPINALFGCLGNDQFENFQEEQLSVCCRAILARVLTTLLMRSEDTSFQATFVSILSWQRSPSG